MFLDLIKSSSPEAINSFLNHLFESPKVIESLSFPLRSILSVIVSISVMDVSEVEVSLPSPFIWLFVEDSVSETTIDPKSIVCSPRSTLFLKVFSLSFPVTRIVSPSNCSVLLQ